MLIKNLYKSFEQNFICWMKIKTMSTRKQGLNFTKSSNSRDIDPTSIW